MAENSVTVMSGGMEINITGNNIQFTISDNKWVLSVAQVESMLESHQLLKDACKQMLSCVYVPLSSDPISINDQDEMVNAVSSAIEALRHAD